MTFGAYLSSRWLPGKRFVLAASTYDGYRRNVERHILPTLGRVSLRRLRPHHLETFYDRLLHPAEGSTQLAPKTVYEIHLVIRGALADAVRRGLVTRNVALVEHAPRLRSICSACAGTTTTTAPARLRSTAAWSPLLTSSTKSAAKPRTVAGASTSTRPQRTSCLPGEPGSRPNSAR